MSVRKLKKTCKKAKGIERRIEREKFLRDLKNPLEEKSAIETVEEIFRKIRKRRDEQKEEKPRRMWKYGYNMKTWVEKYQSSKFKMIKI